MSSRSSSGSWSGAGGAPPDIIDLDKFMRGAVRPPRTDAHVLRCGDKLVVDAGGVDRKPAALGSGAAIPAATSGPPGPAPLTTTSDSSGSRARPHGKHYSHDSGLSDTSYARRKHRPHRRAVGGDNTGVRAPRTPAAGSSDSLRAFRAVCERALLDQQAQIARVAQLCERLSERPLPPPRRRSDRSVTDTSDVSSSSRSTRDQRRKDKHRTDECKTYKIIMNKLDELNRLFAARARSPPHAPPAPLRPAPASSGSVSVSDKLVATEPSGAEREMHVAHNVVTTRGGSTYGTCGSCGATGTGARRVLDVCAHDVLPRPNIVTGRCTQAKNSMVACESRAATGTSGGDPRCGFDLDDPVHEHVTVLSGRLRKLIYVFKILRRLAEEKLYSQAKRLQAMSATTRRARSVEPSAQRFERYERYEHDEHTQRSHRSHRAERREHSLCSLCRGYWRSLTHYLAAQIFCCPDAAVR